MIFQPQMIEEERMSEPTGSRSDVVDEYVASNLDSPTRHRYVENSAPRRWRYNGAPWRTVADESLEPYGCVEYPGDGELLAPAGALAATISALERIYDVTCNEPDAVEAATRASHIAQEALVAESRAREAMGLGAARPHSPGGP